MAVKESKFESTKKPYMNKDGYVAFMKTPSAKSVSAQGEYRHSEMKKPWMDWDYNDMESRPDNHHGFGHIDWPNKPDSKDIYDMEGGGNTINRTDLLWRCWAANCYCPGVITCAAVFCSSDCMRPIFIFPRSSSIYIQEFSGLYEGTVVKPGKKTGPANKICIQPDADGRPPWVNFEVECHGPNGEVGRTSVNFMKCPDTQCCDCSTAVITYDTLTMTVGTTQNLSVGGYSPGCLYEWSTTYGSLANATGQTNVLTAPSSIIPGMVPGSAGATGKACYDAWMALAYNGVPGGWVVTVYPDAVTCRAARDALIAAGYSAQAYHPCDGIASEDTYAQSTANPPWYIQNVKGLIIPTNPAHYAAVSNKPVVTLKCNGVVKNTITVDLTT